MNLYPAGSAAGTLDDILKFAKALLPNSDGSDYLLFDPVSGVGTVIMTNQGSEFIYNYGIPPLIFGPVGAMAHEDGRSNTKEISGLYYAARTTRNGIAKMYTLINLQPYSVNKVRYKRLQDLYIYRELKDTKRLERSIGTLGGGNHFIEVGRDHDDNKYLVIHTGSRNLGTQVANYYQKLAIKLKPDSLDIPRDLCYLTGQYRDEFRREMDGIYTTSVHKSTLDEAPAAYKPMEDILDEIEDTVEVLKIIKPVYNFKAN